MEELRVLGEVLEGQGRMGTKDDLGWGPREKASPEKGREGKESHVLSPAMSLW